MSTQDRAVRGEQEAQSEGHEGGEAASVGVGQIEPMRLRAMQRRWVQRKANGGGGAAAASIPGGGGSPLGGGVQSRMERTLGADLSGVRVHTGGDSAEAAEGLGARAFTVGSDVHFGRGEFAPGSREGDRLLAHELTHVVQGQKSGVQRKADAAHGDSDGGGDHEAGGHEVSEPGDASEKEADAMGDHAADALHGGGDKGGGEHGAAGGEPGGGKKIAGAKPKIAAAAPDIGRKIFRAKSGAKPPPIPADAKKKAPPAPGAAAAAATAPSKSPDEQKAENWCTTNLPKLQGFDAKTSPFSVLTMFESGLVAYKQQFKDNAKVKEALALLDKKKSEVDVAGAEDLNTGIIEPLTALSSHVPGSYQAAGALTAKMQRWKSYFVDASDGPKGFAALGKAQKAIQAFQQEVLKNRDTAIEAAIAAMNGVDVADPKAAEKLDAAFKQCEQWARASGLPGAADKNQQATNAKAAKKQQIDDALKAKQDKEKQEQEKKKQEQQQSKKPAATGGAAASSSAAPTAGTAPAVAATPAGSGAGSTSSAHKSTDAAPQPHAPAGQGAAPTATGSSASSHPADHTIGKADAPATTGGDAHAHSAPAAPAHSPDATHSPGAAHGGDEEAEKKKHEEEKRKVEMEQLEVEIELCCQQYVHKLAWANAGLGAVAALGGLFVPGVHLAGAIKSGAAAAAVVTAELQAKYLTFAIKHLDPKDIQDCLAILSKSQPSFFALKQQIELFLATKENGKRDAKADQAEHHGKRHVAGEAVKGEGPELGAEAAGVALGHVGGGAHAIGEAAGEAAGGIAEQFMEMLPFLSVGFAVNTALDAGNKIMNLRMQLIALQDEAEHLGAQTGRKKI